MQRVSFRSAMTSHNVGGSHDTITLFLVYISLAVVLALWSRKRGHGFWLGFWYSGRVDARCRAAHDRSHSAGRIRQHGERDQAILSTLLQPDGAECNVLRFLRTAHCSSTIKQFLQIAELFAGLVMTVLLVRSVI